MMASLLISQIVKDPSLHIMQIMFMVVLVALHVLRLVLSSELMLYHILIRSCINIFYFEDGKIYQNLVVKLPVRTTIIGYYLEMWVDSSPLSKEKTHHLT